MSHFSVVSCTVHSCAICCCNSTVAAEMAISLAHVNVSTLSVKNLFCIFSLCSALTNLSLSASRVTMLSQSSELSYKVFLVFSFSLDSGDSFTISLQNLLAGLILAPITLSRTASWQISLLQQPTHDFCLCRFKFFWSCICIKVHFAECNSQNPIIRCCVCFSFIMPTHIDSTIISQWRGRQLITVNWNSYSDTLLNPYWWHHIRSPCTPCTSYYYPLLLKCSHYLLGCDKNKI